MKIPKSYLAVLYVSTARKEVLRQLCQLELQSTHVHSFIDAAYNRTSFYLLDDDAAKLSASSVELYEKARSLVDFRQHTGTHPALGFCDNVSISPLFEGKGEGEGEKESDVEFGLQTAGQIARSFQNCILQGHLNREADTADSDLASSNTGTVTGRPVCFSYGHAIIESEIGRSSHQSLRNIRKALGYFDDYDYNCGSKSESGGSGGSEGQQEFLDKVRDNINRACGPSADTDGGFRLTPTAPIGGEEAVWDMDPSIGVTCCGAQPFMLNFNVRFHAHNSSTDEGEKEHVRSIRMVTAALRMEYGEAGRLPQAGVQALTLPYTSVESIKSPGTGTNTGTGTDTSKGRRWEIACNLKNPAVGSAERVLALVQREAMERGLRIECDYITGPTMEQLLQLWEQGKRWRLE